MPTLGERRVCHTFNPSNINDVSRIKQKAANMIDFIDKIPNTNSQTARWKAEAITLFETGAMYAVKAATAGQEQEEEQPNEQSH